MILRDLHRDDDIAADKADQGELEACQALLDDHFVPFLRKSDIQRIQRFFYRMRYGHALACLQPVFLDDDRRAFFLYIAYRGILVVKCRICRGRDAMTHHDALSKVFARFHLRGRLRRSKDLQPFLLERIHHAQGQGVLWSDDRQIDLVLFCERNESFYITVTDIHICRNRFHARIAWCGIDCRDLAAAGYRMRDRMLTPALADDQYFHTFTLALFLCLFYFISCLFTI